MAQQRSLWQRLAGCLCSRIGIPFGFSLSLFVFCFLLCRCSPTRVVSSLKSIDWRGKIGWFSGLKSWRKPLFCVTELWYCVYPTCERVFRYTVIFSCVASLNYGKMACIISIPGQLVIFPENIIICAFLTLAFEETCWLKFSLPGFSFSFKNSLIILVKVTSHLCQ